MQLLQEAAWIKKKKKKTPTNTESYSEQNQIIPNMQKLSKFTLYLPYLRKLLEDILNTPKREFIKIMNPVKRNTKTVAEVLSYKAANSN